MNRKTATPDELAKVWGELNAHRIMLRDLYGLVLQSSDDPSDVEPIKQRVYRLADEIPFPPEHEDMRSAAKVALDRFWNDFEDALRSGRRQGATATAFSRPRPEPPAGSARPR